MELLGIPKREFINGQRVEVILKTRRTTLPLEIYWMQKRLGTEQQGDVKIISPAFHCVTFI